MVNGEAGKGDSYRPVDRMAWSKNWDAIFNKKTATKKKVRKTIDSNRSRKENTNGQG
jgi:hypothetical protein